MNEDNEIKKEIQKTLHSTFINKITYLMLVNSISVCAQIIIRNIFCVVLVSSYLRVFLCCCEIGFVTRDT